MPDINLNLKNKGGTKNKTGAHQRQIPQKIIEHSVVIAASDASSIDILNHVALKPFVAQ